MTYSQPHKYTLTAALPYSNQVTPLSELLYDFKQFIQYQNPTTLAITRHIKPSMKGNAFGKTNARTANIAIETTKYFESIKALNEDNPILAHNQIMNAVGIENISEAKSPRILVCNMSSFDLYFIKLATK